MHESAVRVSHCVMSVKRRARSAGEQVCSFVQRVTAALMHAAAAVGGASSCAASTGFASLLPVAGASAVFELPPQDIARQKRALLSSGRRYVISM